MGRILGLPDKKISDAPWLSTPLHVEVLVVWWLQGRTFNLAARVRVRVWTIILRGSIVALS